MRAKKYHVLKLDLPRDVALYIRKLAKLCRMTESKVVRVILMQQVLRIEAQKKREKHGCKKA